MTMRRRVGGGPGGARPQRIHVEGQTLPLDAAKDHRAQPSIADGQRLAPFRGRSYHSTRGAVAPSSTLAPLPSYGRLHGGDPPSSPPPASVAATTACDQL